MFLAFPAFASASINACLLATHVLEEVVLKRAMAFIFSVAGSDLHWRRILLLAASLSSFITAA